MTHTSTPARQIKGVRPKRGRFTLATGLRAAIAVGLIVAVAFGCFAQIW